MSVELSKALKKIEDRWTIEVPQSRFKNLVDVLKLIHSTHQKLGPDQSDQLRRPEIMDRVKHVLEEMGIEC